VAQFFSFDARQKYKIPLDISQKKEEKLSLRQKNAILCQPPQTRRRPFPSSCRTLHWKKRPKNPDTKQGSGLQ
ncbi:hypothetical protein, partial [Bacteroides sp.]|uniref:hypothetical protein n=1 Tax=Bacteroides sp. TaxID=29523 RepID=UPI0023C902BD